VVVTLLQKHTAPLGAGGRGGGCYKHSAPLEPVGGYAAVDNLEAVLRLHPGLLSRGWFVSGMKQARPALTR
jgi:hypothetical protein